MRYNFDVQIRPKIYFLVKGFQLGDYFCLDTHSGYKKDKTLVGLWSGCKTERKQLIFPIAGNMIIG